MPKENITRREFLHALTLGTAIAIGADKFILHPERGEQISNPSYLWGEGDLSVYNVPRFPESLRLARLESHRISSSTEHSLYGQYVPIGDSQGYLSHTISDGNLRLGLLKILPSIIDPGNTKELDYYAGRRDGGIVYYKKNVALSAIPLTGLSENLIALNAVRISDNSGLQDVLLIDIRSGVIKDKIPSVYSKSNKVEFKSDGERFGFFINGREAGFRNYSFETA